jgi:hypothetical protein
MNIEHELELAAALLIALTGPSSQVPKFLCQRMSLSPSSCGIGPPPSLSVLYMYEHSSILVPQ